MKVKNRSRVCGDVVRFRCEVIRSWVTRSWIINRGTNQVVNSCSANPRFSLFLNYFFVTILACSILNGCTVSPSIKSIEKQAATSTRPVGPTADNLNSSAAVNSALYVSTPRDSDLHDSAPIGRNNFKTKTEKKRETEPRIKSVVLLIGDGMGFQHLKAASLYEHGAEGQLFMQTAPYQHEVATGNVEQAVTDSAAAATAMATGQRVGNRVLSLGPNGEPLETSLEFFQQRCKSTGLVVTSYLNHATPAAFASHQVDRADLKKIAENIFTETKPNVLLGGTADGITAAFAEQAGYTVVRNRAELLAASDSISYISGQFSNGNMGYEYEYSLGLKPYYDLQPHLSEMTIKALDLLDQNPKGFFLMVEGSRIDHASHGNSLPHTIFEVLEFDQTVRAVIEWTAGRSDILVIATADHETGGLSVLNTPEQGLLPEISWATGQHTWNKVPIFGWNVEHEEAYAEVDSTFVHRLTTADFEPSTAQCQTRIESSTLSTPVTSRVHLPIMAAPESP